MRLSQAIEARQQQVQRTDPRQIIASEILAWSAMELEEAVQREITENPALEAREETLPFALPNSFSSPDRFGNDIPMLSEPKVWYLSPDNDNGIDPMERLASRPSLHDHLRSQVGQVANAVTAPIIRYLIECVDERGYLSVNINEVVEQFGAPHSTVEEAIAALQSMEPVGIGARDLHECLLLQATFLEQTGESGSLPRVILTRCWDHLVARRDERIASHLRTSSEAVHDALEFLKHRLTPYPGATFRPPYQSAVSNLPRISPDIIYTRTETGFQIEVARDYINNLRIAPHWEKSIGQATAGDEAMQRYMREHVERAQTFLNGLQRRGRTMRRIAEALVELQPGYLETGERFFLRPLTRQTLAERLNLDESVISRAVADKWVQLPSSEVVLLDSFFGSSQAIREALVRLVENEDGNNPYSDDEIAALLTEQGFPLARRTVAKYRGLEKILPTRLRRRESQVSPAEQQNP